MPHPDQLLSSLSTLAAAPATAPPRLEALAQLAGRLHPVLVHFPIALLIVAGVIELLRAIVGRKEPSASARMCLFLGAAGAAAAAAAGWLNADFEYADSTSSTLTIHRWVGVATASIALVAVIAAVRAAKPGRSLGGYRLVLVLAAALVGVGGHFGGKLTHGETYISSAISAVIGRPAPTTTPAPPTGPGARTNPAPAADTEPSLESRALAILDRSCLGCHGDGRTRGGLKLLSRDQLLAGGKSGPAAIEGNPDASLLVKRLLTDDDRIRMPLDEDPLPDDEVETLKQWIQAGAKWPRSPATAPASGASLAPIETAPRDDRHWSYIPIVTAQLAPSVSKPDWIRNPIDAFVLARLDREKLHPAPEADKAAVLRRVNLDLTGLPPALADLDAFLADNAPDAYQRAVDRLLASPRYGEHWAVWWLDQARYADSHGYEKDTFRSMWPYRDWVIDALNADMPFDQFTIEQLAGDLLPAPTTAQLIATAFHRNTLINEEGGADPEEYRVNAVVDRVNTTATVWLGATLGCAQCHDHKYETFTQKDYYRFFAFFNNSPAESAQDEKAEVRVTSHNLVLREPKADAWDREAAKLEADLKDIADKESVEFKNTQDRLAAVRARLAAQPSVQVMKELDTPRPTHILARGSFLSPGEQVSPGTPECLPPMAEGNPSNRLGLARWLIDPANPLTARVIANRVWAAHFGHGIVGTDDDLGARGDKPTHPELLDHLARELVAHGWSLKHLHRIIVTSNTYRQSTAVSPPLIERDPDNKLLARASRPRLQGETLRDQALAIGGLLSFRHAGPSVFPAQPPGIWSNPYVGDQWKNSTADDAHRRSVYTFWKRSSHYPGFGAFDAPNRTVTCTRRPRTNTPLQALTTLNDPVYVEAASGLARRILTEGGRAAGDRVIFAFRLCLSRPPTEPELARLLALTKQQLANYRASPESAAALVGGAAAASPHDPAELAAWTIVANVLLNLDELLTRN